MTGKGVSWGRDSVGRSAPAFMAASTPALPHLPARREADVIWQLLFAAKPANWWPFVMRPVPSGESAGCVRLQWLVLRAVCLLPFLPAMPTALHQRSCPRSSLLCPVQIICFVCLPTCSFPCAPGSFEELGPAVCQLQDCPVGSCNTGLQWRPVHRSICADSPFLFPAESMILGHGLV